MKKNIFLISVLSMVWLFVSLFSASAVGTDSMEEMVWAQNFEWGYQKHPPLPIWLLVPIIKYANNLTLPFVFAFLCIFAANLTIFSLYSFILKENNIITSDKKALFAILITSPIAYYTFIGWHYNHNIVQLFPIAGMYLFYYKVFSREIDIFISKKKIYYLSDCTILGIFSALTLLSKYSGIIQIFVLFSHFLYSKKWKEKIYMYAACYTFFIMLIILIPHIFWLVQSNAQENHPIHYITRNVFDNNSFFYTVLILIKSFAVQFFRILPVFLLFYIWRFFIKKKKDYIKIQDTCLWNKLKSSDQIFLQFCIFGPLIITFFLVLILRINLKPDWCFTFYLCFGSLFWKSKLLNFLSTKVVVITTIAIHIFFGSCFYLTRTYLHDYIGYISTSNYPSKLIAKEIFDVWKRYDQNKSFSIIGDIWTIGNITIWDRYFGFFTTAIPDTNKALLDLQISKKDTESILIILNNSQKRGKKVSKTVEELYNLSTIKGRICLPWKNNPNLCGEDCDKIIIDWAIIKPMNQLIA